VWAKNAFAERYYSAGSSQERLQDFHVMLADDSIRAIIFSVGGDTALDLLAGLDYGLIKKKPKIISGISDATTLLHAISAKTGLITFLGMELKYYASEKMSYQDQSFRRAWFGDYQGQIQPNINWREIEGTFTRYHGWQTIRGGGAEGRLVGGNFSCLLQLVDTEYQLPFAGNILFIETYKWPKKKIHRALMQLKLRGLLDGLSGMIVGYCMGSDDQEDGGNNQPLGELILEVADEYNFPIMQVGEIGHQVENFTQPMGARVRIDASNLMLEVLEPVTA
jgi:muramoyltetrapeptide carboxypeptidase